MVFSSDADPEDLRIVRALQIDPRVSIATMASVLGMSEPAVSRRYARLERRGVFRVVGVVNPGALGQSQWTVRLRCRPGSVEAIAEALARREDIGWVSLGEAGAEVTCAVRARSQQQREDLLGRRLPRAAAVLDFEAAMMLRQFLGGRGHYWAALDGVLSAAQERELGSSGNPFVEAPVFVNRSRDLPEHDERLVAALADDGRASLVDLAAAADLTPGRVSRRLQALVADGVVHIDVELSPAALGFNARANLWLRVHPSAIKSVGRALADMAEVGFVAAMSGRNNVHAVIHCRDLDDLFEFTSDRVGGLSGVEAAEVSPIQRQVKQVGTLVDGDRLARR